MITSINQLAAEWGGYLLIMLLQNSLFIAIALILIFLLRRQNPQYLRLIALLALVKVFIPPFISLESAPALESFTAPVLSLLPAATETFKADSLSLMAILLILWISITITLTSIAIYNYWQLRKLAQSAESFSLPFLKNINVPVLRSHSAHSPFVLGFFRHRIVFPESASEWTPIQIRTVIAHEMSHIRQNDHWVNLLQMLAGALFFFNPLIIMLNRRLNDLREKICDDAAIQSLDQTPEEYVRCLLDLASLLTAGGRQQISGVYFSQSAQGLRERIIYQLNRKGVTMKRFTNQKNLLIVAMFALLISPFSCEWQSADEGAEITSPESTVKITKGEIVNFADLTEPPVLTTPASPEYPEAAKKNQLEGKVMVKMLIGRHGLIEDAQILDHPEASQDASLQEAALAAAKKMKFSPGKKDGQTVKVWVTVPFQFKLN